METAERQLNTDDAATVAAKRELVARVADSDLFQKAPRLREFLLYAAECTLENRLSEVREQVIAERVFSRKPDFQGTQDSIVRAEARNLRKRLQAYFADEGRQHPIVITMPKGGYALAFESRPSAVDLEVYATPAQLSGVPPVALPHIAPIVTPRWNSTPWLLGIFGMLLAAVSLGFVVGHREGRASFARALPATPSMLPFSALFAQDRSSVIVTSDTGFLQIASVVGHPLSLDDYVARSYPAVPGIKPQDLIRNWNLDEYTDGREMSVAGSILSQYPRFAGNIALRSGHGITLETFKTHTAVLIGSPISNPWAQLFEDRLNFRCEFDHSGHILFRAVIGQPNPPATYPNADDIQHGRAYARLAFLPGSADTPAALLIAGTTAQSTESAGELVTDAPRFARTLRSIGIDPTGPPRFFEILLRSNFFVGGSTVPELAAWRLNPAPEK